MKFAEEKRASVESGGLPWLLQHFSKVSALENDVSLEDTGPSLRVSENATALLPDGQSGCH